MRQRRTPLLGALAVVLAVAAHVNALNDPFVWDDVKGVQENVSIESLSRPLAIVRHNVTRPLVNLSYALDYRIWRGRSAFGFHATNLSLHLANVALLFAFVWLVVRGLGRSRGPDASVSGRSDGVHGRRPARGPSDDDRGCRLRELPLRAAVRSR